MLSFQTVHQPNRPPKRAKATPEELRETLQRHFGYSEFRGLQERAIRSALSGQDVFILMPTGGGKSMCYTIPALAGGDGSPGVVVVVSPLIALMENQVEALRARGIKAEHLSSSRAAAEKAAVHEDLGSRAPQTKLLYVTPELLATSGFPPVLQSLRARQLLILVAIDEAHCISSWGHDFRPAYRKLSSLKKSLPGVPLMALTATAAPKVRQDILNNLGMQDALVLQASYNRPNISYEVRYVDIMTPTNPYKDLRGVIREMASGGGGGGGSGGGGVCGIVYAHTRETCESVAGQLSADGVSASAYHAGMNPANRSRVLQDWEAGRVAVVVATVAFGMGIDRQGVRLVVHYNLPKTIEGLYQESGRAGRDGRPARHVLYYHTSDRSTMEFLISKDRDKKKKAQNVAGGGVGLGLAGSEVPAQSFAKVVQ